MPALGLQDFLTTDNRGSFRKGLLYLMGRGDGVNAPIFAMTGARVSL